MIPGIEEIIAGLLAGTYTKEQAQSWLNTHMELAAMNGRGIEYPEQGHVHGDEFQWDFPILHFGHGPSEVGDATWEGRPSLIFGRNGQGLGVERDRNEPAENGETLALFTFVNLAGLEALEAATARVRAAMQG